MYQLRCLEMELFVTSARHELVKGISYDKFDEFLPQVTINKASTATATHSPHSESINLSGMYNFNGHKTKRSSSNEISCYPTPTSNNNTENIRLVSICHGVYTFLVENENPTTRRKN